MGVDITFYVGPKPDETIPEENFISFIDDLVKSNLLVSPWAISAGELDPDPVGMSNDVSALIDGKAGSEPGNAVQLLAHGDDIHSSISALADIEFNNANIGISFSEGLNWENEELVRSFEKAQCYNGCVGIYSFKQPKAIRIYDAYDEDGDEYDILLRQYFSISGSGTMYDLVDSPLKNVILKHFDGDLVTGTCAA